MKPDGVAAPIGPVLGIPRKTRDRVRIALVGAMAVVVIATGVGLAGNGLASPDPSPSASPTKAVAISSSSPIPSASPGKLPPPTQNSGLGCSPVRLGAPPEIQLGREPNNVGAIRGAPATSPTSGGSPAPATGGPGRGSPAPSWPTLPADGALRLPGNAIITVYAEQDACMRYVIAEYLPGATGVTLPFPIAFRTVNVSPPRSIQPLGTMPSGDWVVRIVAYFSTGASGEDGSTVLERYFRVVNSAAPVPIPGPVTSPAVACTPPPPGGVAPALVLAGSPGGPIEGGPRPVGPPAVPVRLGDRIEIRIAGDACAIGWDINATQAGTGAGFQIDQMANETNDPFLYAQNRWLLHDLPTGTVTITATIRFSADVDVTRQWLIDVMGADVPVVRIVSPGGAHAPTVRASCGASWTFPTGTGGYENCATEEVPGGLPVLTVAPETALTLDVPGWTLRGWGGACGRPEPANGSGFMIVSGCDLGGWYSTDGGPALPGPAMFLPRTAGPLVRLYVQAERDGIVASVVVYLNIVATP